MDSHYEFLQQELIKAQINLIKARIETEYKRQALIDQQLYNEKCKSV